MIDESPRKQNLFDIGHDLNQIAEAYDQLEEQGTDEVYLASIEAFFGQLLDQRDAKLDGYAALITQRLAHAKIRTDEANRLRGLAKIDENLAERLKARLKEYFDQEGITKIETALHKFAIQNNGGVLPLVLVEGLEPEGLPEEFRKLTVTVDSEKLREAVEAGEAPMVPNLLFDAFTDGDQPEQVPAARIGDRGSHLRIR